MTNYMVGGLWVCPLVIVSISREGRVEVTVLVCGSMAAWCQLLCVVARSGTHCPAAEAPGYPRRSVTPQPRPGEGPPMGRVGPFTARAWWASLAYLECSGTLGHAREFQEPHVPRGSNHSQVRRHRCPSD